MNTADEDQNSTEKTVLVFQLWEGEEGIFFTKENYMYLKMIQAALDKAKTWRDFVKLLPPGEFDKLGLWEDDEYIYRDGEDYRGVDPSKLDEIVEYFGPEHVINADDAFDANLIPGFYDANYPPWMDRTAIEFLPDEFVEKYGEWVGSPAAGSWCEFPKSHLKEMIKFLGERGFSVIPHTSFDLTWLRQIELTR